MTAVTELAVDVGTSAACQALTVPRASYYRERRKIFFPTVTASRPSPARALRPMEREAVLSRLHEERFQDRSPAAVYATLLDEGEYHCSIRTMYRLLEQRGESRERRDQHRCAKVENRRGCTFENSGEHCSHLDHEKNGKTDADKQCGKFCLVVDEQLIRELENPFHGTSSLPPGTRLFSATRARAYV